MDFDLSPEQQQIRQTLDQFAAREILPHRARWDREGIFPRRVIEQLGELGFLGIAFEPRWGGGGADTLSLLTATECLSRHDASVGLTYAAHVSLAGAHIALFAGDEQRIRYLPGLVSGKLIGAWCLTEPDTGSDAAAMRTRAVRSGDNWTINGAKMFITNGTVADVYVVNAATSAQGGRDGASAFIVERGVKGLRNGRRIEKLGLRASDTGEVIFEDVVVPAGALIGELNAGYRQTLKVLEGGRIGVAAFAVGIARAGLEEALAYVRQRTQFGQRIADFQGVQWMLADMATRVEAAWLLACRAARLKDRGRPVGRAASIAKLYASEAAMWVTTKAVQLHGGYGYMSEFPVERYMRDAKLAEIGEGTSEIQRLLISKSLLAEGYLPEEPAAI